MSCRSSCQRPRSPVSRCARSSASTGGSKSRFQRPVQNAAVASVVRPGALANKDRLLGARPANAAAQDSTAWPVGDSNFRARPCPGGAERPGQRALSWSCSRCCSTRRASTSWERWRTAPSSASTTCGSAGRPAPCLTSQTSAAQSRSSVLNRREPSCALAAAVSDGANSRNDPGQRRSISAAHARCNPPVASRPITGDPTTPLEATSRSSSSTPSRSTGNETGSPISPRSPLVSHTRLNALPGSIATTSELAGTSLRNSSKEHLPHPKPKERPSRPAPRGSIPSRHQRPISETTSETRAGSAAQPTTKERPERLGGYPMNLYAAKDEQREGEQFSDATALGEPQDDIGDQGHSPTCDGRPRLRRQAFLRVFDASGRHPVCAP